MIDPTESLNNGQRENEQRENDRHWMRRALALAERACALGEVPVGALVVRDGQVLGEGWNQPIAACDPSAHAEIQALRQAAAGQHNYRLPGATLYVTIEPCTMCFGALVHARIERVVFGAREAKAGVIASHHHLLDSGIYNHQFSYSEGVLEEECRALIQQFFKQRRERKRALRQTNKGAGDSC